MSRKKNVYSDLLDKLDQYDDYKESAPDKEGEEFIKEFSREMKKIIEEYAEEEYDLEKILREDDYLLEELVDRVAYLNFVEANAGDDAGHSDVSEEDMENAYLSVIDSLFELSKTITPMAGVGKDRLEAGLSLIKTYEERFGPLSTQITAENISAFEDYLTAEYIDDIRVGKRYAIGALRHVGNDMCAVGVLVYSLNRGSGNYPLSFSLDRIMIDKNFRETGIGNFLMAELLEIVIGNEGTDLFVSIPVVDGIEDDEKDEQAVMANFFDSWGFVFSLEDSTEFVIKIAECKGNSVIEKKNKKAVSLYRLGDKGAAMLKDFFNRHNKDYNADVSSLPYDFFDVDVSSAVVSGDKIRSVFLVHRFENGNYRYEALRFDPDHGETDIPDLLGCTYKSCVSIDDGEGMIFGTFESEEGFKLIKKLFPGGRILLKYKGVLTVPDADSVITTDEWDELRAEVGFSDNKIPDRGLDDESIGENELGMIKDYIRKYSE